MPRSPHRRKSEIEALRSLTYEDIPADLQQEAADNLGNMICALLNFPRERLKEVNHFGATELGNKTGLVFVFEPKLTEEEEKRFKQGLELLNALAGGRPIIYPGQG